MAALCWPGVGVGQTMLAWERPVAAPPKLRLYRLAFFLPSALSPFDQGPGPRAPPFAMNLLYANMITVTICCVLLVGGFAARQRRYLPAVMMLLGVAGLLAVFLYNIHRLSN
jgi:hypothetical protein